MSLYEGLDVIVVGAGIAGLSAAIALRRAGHKVQIFEQSDLNNELGAAIHLSPNAARILLPWGMDPDRGRFVVAKTTYIANGETLARLRGRLPVDLHGELKRMISNPEAPGPPVMLIANVRVVNHDATAGAVTLADGTTYKADLVIAADGVHSGATEVVFGTKNRALPTDQTAFRFLIPTSVLAEDPETAHFLEGDDGRFKVFMGDGKRIVWYPCRNNEEQNFVGIFQDDEKDMREGKYWNVAVEQNELLEVYRNFHPSILAVLKKATHIKKWPLLFRFPISPWYSSKLVLIGDAAHPMLPLQGQAGAQAIEDSAALAIMISDLTKSKLQANPNLTSERLELFQKDQAAGVAEAVKPYFGDGVPVPKSPDEFIVYNFSHDVVKESLKVLKEHEEARGF
ncbi:related to salicylate hydroxylase [Phialocephala subalpina]|uniref:Related to salicylate hydroxylase n=1 Tax=Phialocephala subalpina TaxID=576137 RepID=A0A1L7XIB9_9HELO|nr:related to salicylate hydroxylase [Phialocephala subalpina]